MQERRQTLWALPPLFTGRERRDVEAEGDALCHACRLTILRVAPRRRLALRLAGGPRRRARADRAGDVPALWA